MLEKRLRPIGIENEAKRIGLADTEELPAVEARAIQSASGSKSAADLHKTTENSNRSLRRRIAAAILAFAGLEAGPTNALMAVQEGAQIMPSPLDDKEEHLPTMSERLRDELKEELASPQGVSARRARARLQGWMSDLPPKRQYEMTPSDILAPVNEDDKPVETRLSEEVMGRVAASVNKQVELLFSPQADTNERSPSGDAQENVMIRVDRAVQTAVRVALREIEPQKNADQHNAEIYAIHLFAVRFRDRFRAEPTMDIGDRHRYFVALHERAADLVSFETDVIDRHSAPRHFDLNQEIDRDIAAAEYQAVPEGSRTALFEVLRRNNDHDTQLARVALETDLSWVLRQARALYKFPVARALFRGVSHQLAAHEPDRRRAVQLREIERLMRL